MTRKEKRAMMESVVQDWQASGITQVEYARVHELNDSRLRYWIRKSAGIEQQQSAFIQMGPPQGIQIRYPHGVDVILPAQTPSEPFAYSDPGLSDVLPWCRPVLPVPGTDRYTQKFRWPLRARDGTTGQKSHERRRVHLHKQTTQPDEIAEMGTGWLRAVLQAA